MHSLITLTFKWDGHTIQYGIGLIGVGLYSILGFPYAVFPCYAVHALYVHSLSKRIFGHMKKVRPAHEGCVET